MFCSCSSYRCDFDFCRIFKIRNRIHFTHTLFFALIDIEELPDWANEDDGEDFVEGEEEEQEEVSAVTTDTKRNLLMEVIFKTRLFQFIADLSSSNDRGLPFYSILDLEYEVKRCGSRPSRHP